jgi:rhamnogalacturonyl hydrolase YesR
MLLPVLAEPSWHSYISTLSVSLLAVMLQFYRFPRYLVILLAACNYASSTPVAKYSGNAIQAGYVSEAISAANVLQRELYDSASGLWYGYDAACKCSATFWWISANCITTLADLTAVDSVTSILTNPIFINTFAKAPNFNPTQSKTIKMEEYDYLSRDNGAQKPLAIITASFINNFYDDDAWWALAWIRVYDLTHNDVYLDAAVDIFYEMAFNGHNATCGGMYWNQDHQEQNAITNELFLSLAAHLATRVDNSDYYIGWALRQWSWFESSGLIQPSGLVVDGLDNTTCVARSNAPTFSYNQGVILGALVELNKIHPNETYINIAHTIATAAIENLSNANGILTEFGSNGNSDLGLDGPVFKGVFIRNLRILQQATGNEDYASFIRKNADSISSTNRSPVHNIYGNVWDEFGGLVSPQGHCAAMDAIVAAAAVSG